MPKFSGYEVVGIILANLKICVNCTSDNPMAHCGSRLLATKVDADTQPNLTRQNLFQ